MRTTSTDRPARTRAERRLRRAVHAVTGTLAIGAMALTGGLTALPASAAAPARPAVQIVTGDRVLTAAWTGVPGAASYTVRVSTKRSLADARVKTTTKRTVKVGKLKNNRRYFVAVTANGAGIVPARARSRVQLAVAKRGLPFQVSGVTVTPGDAPHTVRVRWTGGGRAKKVAVVAGSSVITQERSFNSGWYPATTRSITLTVPDRLRPYLGAGTGNPVWVRVVQSNSGSQVFGSSYSAARLYRISPTGTWAFARGTTPPAVPVTKLRVAEYNTQSIGASADYSADNRWAARVHRVAKNVNTADPDLLLTAELSTSLVRSCTNSIARDTYCTSAAQYSDLGDELNGLKVAGEDAYKRVVQGMRKYPRWEGNVTNGAHVFYDPSTLKVLDHGYFAPALTPAQSFENVAGLGVSGWTGSEVGPDRWLSWAKLRSTRSDGRVFYAVAAHFPTGNGARVTQVRGDLARKLVPAIERLAGKTPVVFGGDLNTDAVRSPQPGQPEFTKRGWLDAAAVATKADRKGQRVSTANGSGGGQDGRDSGYNSKPVLHPYETSRIDYILLKNSPYTYSYENVLRTDKSGGFDRSTQGSDHNMQLATVGIAGPTS